MKNADDDIRELLDQKAEQYNRPDFIADDPVSVPHAFSKKEDIEIAGFLAAIIAWGQRTVIIRNAMRLMEYMDHCPHDFLLDAGPHDLEVFKSFKHRTFNGDDCRYFISALGSIYRKRGGLESVFEHAWNSSGGDMGKTIHTFRQVFFEAAPPGRTSKHIADPLKGSSAKRINMFLRWMVRDDDKGVDFGLWKGIRPAALCCPLDVHTGNVARKLGMISRNANDWRSVLQLTGALREMDPLDPVKYDFALFGLGMYENF